MSTVHKTSRIVAIVKLLLEAREQRDHRIDQQIDRLRQVRGAFAMRAFPLLTAALKGLGVYKETNDSRAAKMACLLESIRADQMADLQRVLTP